MSNGEKTEKKPVSPINGQPVPNGRPKGVPNKATTRFKEALNTLFEESSDKMIGWLEEVDNPKDRFDILSKFVEVLYPKLARQELVGDPEKPITHKHDHTLKSRLLAEIPQEKLEAIAKEVEGAGD